MAGRDKKRGHPKNWSAPYPLPRDTAHFANHYRERSQNLILWLDRFITWEDEEYKKIWVHEKHKKEKKWVDTTLSRSRDANQRKVPMLKLDKDTDVLQWIGDNNLLQGLKKRWRRMLASYTYKRDFTACPAWRFVVGLGGAHVLETGMTLHRLYGIPIIPGSTLKGLARAYAEEVKGKGSDDPDIVAIFGKPPLSTPLETGEIIFFDAIPVSRPKFKLDVMTPHFPQYYQGNEPPADWQNPNPIYFLTVTSTTFLFAVAARRDEGKEYVKIALEWLKGGLAELGVGAKTAAGYGYFEEEK